MKNARSQGPFQRFETFPASNLIHLLSKAQPHGTISYSPRYRQYQAYHRILPRPSQSIAPQPARPPALHNARPQHALPFQMSQKKKTTPPPILLEAQQNLANSRAPNFLLINGHARHSSRCTGFPSYRPRQPAMPCTHH
ncbi:hypothetical protein EJ04DRAFT_95976 [Polyplosphaeria fusca]|uniref:Uncharacterized protein n=1 Tax=Polyplosphaeria fusca TaxID=682080 RepID=A0A9P4R1L5_9PLEO|nr:hypothetical protein EJ04DRAFT_95976 [Polyplosphaeria fusca]